MVLVGRGVSGAVADEPRLISELHRDGFDEQWVFFDGSRGESVDVSRATSHDAATATLQQQSDVSHSLTHTLSFPGTIGTWCISSTVMVVHLAGATRRPLRRVSAAKCCIGAGSTS